MLVEVKTHSPPQRRKKWYFNIWSLSSLFLAFASLRSRRRKPGEREEGKKEGDASKPQPNLLPLSQVWSFGKTILSSRAGIRLSATGNNGLSTKFNT